MLLLHIIVSRSKPDDVLSLLGVTRAATEFEATTGEAVLEEEKLGLR